MYWLFSASVGLVSGVFVGLATAKFSIFLSLDGFIVYAFTLFVGGGLIFLWVLPIENKYYYSRVNTEYLYDDNQEDKWLPFSICLLIGCLAGVRNEYNIASGLHCILPLLC